MPETLVEESAKKTPPWLIPLFAFFAGCAISGCDRSPSPNVIAPVNALPVKADPPANLPVSEVAVDLSPHRIVRFSIDADVGGTSNDEHRYEDCGELLLHPASGRFVYRLWHDWPTAQRHFHEWLENPQTKNPEHRKFLQGSAGFDGTHYWRVLNFPVPTYIFGREAYLFHSFEDVRKHDLEAVRESADRS